MHPADRAGEYLERITALTGAHQDDDGASFSGGCVALPLKNNPRIV